MTSHIRNTCAILWPCVLLLIAIASASGSAQAHSSSNSYITVSSFNEAAVLRADINLRDIDLVFDLDQNKDGKVSWGETLAKTAELKVWLEQGIQLSTKGQKCALAKMNIKASDHADGTYLSVEWTVACLDVAEDGLSGLTLRYDLMFDQDNLHRALVKIDLPNFQSSAILSPDRPEFTLTKASGSSLKVLERYLLEGVWHIWIGIDHVLFLLSLLILACLEPNRKSVIQWPAVQNVKTAVLDILAVVTAFTLAHSITLGLTIFKWLEPSADLIEPAIALSVVAAALNNLLGWAALRRWQLAFAFGLVHGFGFANVLVDLGLPSDQLAIALGGFNLGVELGQIAIVLLFLPLAWWLRNTLFYRWVVVVGGSLTIAVLGIIWTLQRTVLQGL
jgi:hypothetical protein